MKLDVNSTSANAIRAAQMAMKSELLRAEKEFEVQRSLGRVRGDFRGLTWNYGGTTYTFTICATRGQKNEPLRGVASLIARLFLLESIKDGRSSELLRSRLAAVRLMVEHLGEDIKEWIQLDQRRCQKIIDQVKQKYSKATLYHRAGAISQLVRHLSRIEHVSDGGAMTFFAHPFIWRHGVANPTRAIEDPTTAEFTKHRNSRYLPGLETAIGQLRSAVLANSTSEPKPGFFRIRTESLAFFMALGLRVNEVTTLQASCLTTRHGTPNLAIRVWTEKCHLPGVRAVPEIWRQALIDAHQYLLHACADARARARRIEREGFGWVRKDLEKLRAKEGIDPSIAISLRAANLHSSDYFSVVEMCRCYDMSPKEFNQGGSYDVTVRRICGKSVSTIICWLDDRFACWDWDTFAKKKRSGIYVANTKSLSVTAVGVLSGAPKSEMAKLRDLSKSLALILKTMAEKKCFSRRTSAQRRNALRAQWSQLRKCVLSNSSRRSVLVVSVDEFSRALQKKYVSLLERHYKENLEDRKIFKERSVDRSCRSSVPLSDHLMVVWEDQFNGITSHCGILPRPLFRVDLYHFLCSNDLKKTAFQTFDIRSGSGQTFSITPHQFRHWLTSALLRSGPSEMMIDRWMGRTPGQTRQYDMRTSSERAESVRRLYLSDKPPGDFLGSKVISWREDGLSGQEISELITAKLQVIHFVPWGQCSRDLTASPCDKGMMCLRGFGTDKVCKSFHIDPGDKVARKATRELRDKYANQLTIFEPKIFEIRERFEKNLQPYSTLDQHLKMMMDVVRGCNAALRVYDDGVGRASGDFVRLLDVVEHE